MSGLARLAGVFLEPRAVSHQPSGASGSCAVVCGVADIAPVAAVVARAVRVGGRSRALVCWWAPADVSDLAVRGVRLARLPDSPAEHDQFLERECAAAPGGPLVLLAAGCRPAALDDLLRRADALVVAVAEAELEVGEVVWERLRGAEQRGGVVSVPTGIERGLALAGIAVGGASAAALSVLLASSQHHQAVPARSHHALA